MARIPVHEKIIDRNADRELRSLYKNGGSPFVFLPQVEYQALRLSAHRCFFHNTLLNGIPIILRPDLSPGEWSYKTVPERLEVSNEIYEAIKAIKTPFEWHEFEEALRSPRK